MKYQIRTIKRFFRDTKHGLQNLSYYFNVIWNDRDWDYQFINKLLHKKLSRMEKRFSSDKVFIADADIVAKDIRLAKLLLERVMRRDYYSNSKESSLTRNKVTWHTDYMEKQDVRMLFDQMKKYQRWWD